MVLAGLGPHHLHDLGTRMAHVDSPTPTGAEHRLFGGIAAGLSGISVVHFFITNVLIGAGWNFMLVGATALLVTCHTEDEKGKVQGANDTIAYILAAISSFFAGYLQIEFGWSAVMIAIIPQVLLVGAAVWWMRAAGTQTVAAE